MAKRWKVQKEECWTECEGPHPQRLKSGAQVDDRLGIFHPYNLAVANGKKGWMCPGMEEHPYYIWTVYDTIDDQLWLRGGEDTFTDYRSAKEMADELNKERP